MIVDRLLRVALAGSSWVLYLLLGLSVVSLAAMLDRWLFFRRHKDDVGALRRRLEAALLAGDESEVEALLARSPSLEAKIIGAVWRWRSGGPAALSDALDSELSHARKVFERGSNLLGTLGNNAPFVGLLGTVLGVIEAFHQLGAAPQGGAMGNVMSGIAEALVATGVGLFVALPAVVAYNVLQQRIGQVEANVVSLGKLLSAGLKSHEAQREEDTSRALAAATVERRAGVAVNGSREHGSRDSGAAPAAPSLE